MKSLLSVTAQVQQYMDNQFNDLKSLYVQSGIEADRGHDEDLSGAAWGLLDNNPATKAIAASGGNLYQLHNTGLIWRYTGTPLTGWEMLDNNPASAAITSGAQLYQIQNDGLIWRS